MQFSIVTPSYRNSEWLKLCIASVADQGVSLEHIVQDAGSDDGTLDWLLADSRVTAHVEKDSGMYDAINRGLARARGEICAYLNCDEQYLPGALHAVEDFFSSHPNVDVLFADFIVVNPGGEYLFHRKVQTPLKNHLRVSHLPAFSCAMFFRRRVITGMGIHFDSRLRAVGDGDWVLRLLERGVTMAVMRQFTSVFTLHDENLGESPAAKDEAMAMHAAAPFWVRATKPVWILHHRLRRLLGGMYSQAPFSFSPYTRQSQPHRTTRAVPSPRSRWRPLPPRTKT
ncbi:MAG: glycosyltransferase [Verrucomicrobia bacterium]|nr:MAG: glycosyltransferase [Verrucomicrobiota bacterium]